MTSTTSMASGSMWVRKAPALRTQTEFHSAMPPLRPTGSVTIDAVTSPVAQLLGIALGAALGNA
jgi:hypothetical protein